MQRLNFFVTISLVCNLRKRGAKIVVDDNSKVRHTLDVMTINREGTEAHTHVSGQGRGHRRRRRRRRRREGEDTTLP